MTTIPTFKKNNSILMVMEQVIVYMEE